MKGLTNAYPVVDLQVGHPNRLQISQPLVTVHYIGYDVQNQGENNIREGTVEN